jgi:short-subunit dehydrogenase
MAEFTDNVVVVAGASRGIGQQMAYQLADQHAKLVLAARGKEKLSAVAEECKRRGADVIAVPTDLTDEAACRKLIERAAKHWGRIDTLLYNAGGGQTSRFDARPDLADARHEMAINYFGLASCVHGALPYLKLTQGRIVGVSSMGGVIGLPGTSTYNASKHAMRGFLRSLRAELTGAGVSVTVVYLSAVRTENFLKNMGEKAGSVPSVTPEQAAASIISAGAARRRDVIPSPEGRLLAFLYPIMPRLLDGMLVKQVGALYEE